MLDNERNTSTSYFIRKLPEDDLSCYVKTYPKRIYSSDNMVFGTYRYDAMPEWMVEGMRMLDAAAVDGVADIPGYGQLSSGGYWFLARQIMATQF